MKKLLIFVFIVVLVFLMGCAASRQDPAPVLPEEKTTAAKEETEIISEAPVAEETAPQEIADSSSMEQETSEERPVVQEKEYANYIYVPNENFTALCKEPVEMDIVDVRQLTDLLTERKVLPKGTAVLSLLVRDSGSSYPYIDSTTKYVVGSQWVELDISEAFLQVFEDCTPEQESLIMASLTNTVLGYFGLEEMTITCEGRLIETPNDRYNYDLVFTPVD